MEDEPLDEYRHGYEKAARFYNLFAQNNDIPFYIDYAQKMGSPILDLAAGTGRVSIALAIAGFEVTALESSKHMVNEFKVQVASNPPEVAERITIIEGNMTDFEISQRFPLIIVPTSFGHALTTDEQLSLLSCVREHLTEDGLFIVDLFPGGVQPRNASFEENPVDIEDGLTVTRSGVISTDPLRQIMSLDLTFTVRNKKSGDIVEQIYQKSGVALVYTREAELLVRASGMRIISEYGDFTKKPYSKHSGRRILILSKNEAEDVQ
ncbi:MAG: class I SAM-dependent methyltransferase [Candidatus Thorarchaeota archaeon]